MAFICQMRSVTPSMSLRNMERHADLSSQYCSYDGVYRGGSGLRDSEAFPYSIYNHGCRKGPGTAIGISSAARSYSHSCQGWMVGALVTLSPAQLSSITTVRHDSAQQAGTPGKLRVPAYGNGIFIQAWTHTGKTGNGTGPSGRRLHEGIDRALLLHFACFPARAFPYHATPHPSFYHSIVSLTSF